jgi:hypothetical protein
MECLIASMYEDVRDVSIGPGISASRRLYRFSILNLQNAKLCIQKVSINAAF